MKTRIAKRIYWKRKSGLSKKLKKKRSRKNGRVNLISFKCGDIPLKLVNIILLHYPRYFGLPPQFFENLTPTVKVGNRHHFYFHSTKGLMAGDLIVFVEER